MSKHIKLSNGVMMPSIGFGTWQIPDGSATEEMVSFALKNGYSLIDTAARYGNEKGIGAAIRASGIPREQIFVTSKVWNRDRGYEKTKIAFLKTLSNLRLDYLDLYLIHWPANKKQFSNADEINMETWRAITEFYEEGKVRAIGVANFLPHHLDVLMQTKVKPMVDQIEYHPGWLQTETVRYCQEHGIAIEAWSPLGCGKILKDPRLISIASHYGKSTAQLCIRFAMQNGIIPLPKSSTKARILENIDTSDFEISDIDMAEIKALGDFSGSGFNPDEILF